MKKLLASIFAVLCLGFTLCAQDGFGVVGGVTTSSTEIEDSSFDNITSFHAGIAYKSPNLFGFAVQPELMYNVKGTHSDIQDIKMGYAELGIQLQWGPDLVLFRPYVFVEPYLGYAVKNWVSMSGGNAADVMNDVFTNLKRTEAGLGVGGGVELFGTLQLSARHFRNFGEVYSEGFDAKNSIFGGWVFTLGLFF